MSNSPCNPPKMLVPMDVPQAMDAFAKAMRAYAAMVPVAWVPLETDTAGGRLVYQRTWKKSGYENISTALNRVTMGAVIEQIDIFTVLDVNFAVMSVMPTQSGIEQVLVNTTDYLRDVLGAADCYDIYVNDFPDKQVFDELFVLANTVHDTHGLVHRHRQALADFCAAHKGDLEMAIRRYAAVLEHYGPVNEVVETAYGLRPVLPEVAGGLPQVDADKERLTEAILALWKLQGGSG